MEIAGQQVTVTHHAEGPSGSLTPETTPAVSKPAKIELTVEGELVIDLTDLDVVVELADDSAVLTRDLTGLNLLQVKFRTPITNTVPIVVAPGDTDGYPIGTRKLYPNGCDGFFQPNNDVPVGATAKKIKLTSAAPADLVIVIAAGN